MGLMVIVEFCFTQCCIDSNIVYLNTTISALLKCKSKIRNNTSCIQNTTFISYLNNINQEYFFYSTLVSSDVIFSHICYC